MGTLTFSEVDRAGIVRRGRALEIFSILWAGLEAAVALFTALQTNSLSLTGFGFDSLIEMVSGAALLWRLSPERDEPCRHRAEHISLHIAGACLLTLGGYLLVEASAKLWNRRSSATSEDTGRAAFLLRRHSQARQAFPCLSMPRDACRADAMKKKIMAERAESTRQFGLDRRYASFEFVDLSTIVAQEVMVVFFPG